MNSILKYSPILSGLLVLLGVVKLSVFFSHFNIDIISYLTLGDILIAFLNDLHTIAIVVVIAFLHSCISHDLILDSKGELIQPIVNVLLRFRKSYTIGFGLIAAILISLLSFKIIDLALWNIYMTVFVISNFFVYLFMRQDSNSVLPKIKFIFTRLFDGLQVMVISSMIVLLALYEIQETYNDDKKVKIELLNGSHIQSEGSLLYLGKVGDYHYFFNSVSGLKTIIPKDQVKRLFIQ